MNILLYKDGHLAVSESPLEGKENNLEDVVMLITNPQEGDSLTYKGGKWVNGAGGSGGGGGAMLLTITPTETGAIADATYAEVKAAMYAGKSVGFIYNSSGEHLIYQLQKCVDSSSTSHGDPHIAEFWNMTTTSEFAFYADTEDSLLYFDPNA